MFVCWRKSSDIWDVRFQPAKQSRINEISLKFKRRCPVGQPTPKHRIVKFPAGTMNYLPPGAQELIINPVALLQIYCAPSELQVSNCRTYGAFQLFTPWNGAAGVRVSPLGWQRAKQTAVLLKPASRVGAVAAFSPPTARFSSPLSSEHLSKHITGSRVSTAAARPRRSLRVLTQCLLRCPYPGHRADRPLLCEVCVCVCVCVCVSPQGWFWVYSDSPAGWAMATTGGPRRPRRRDTPHTLSILPDRCAYLKEDSLSPSLLRSIIFHWATEQTWQSWQAIAVGWACNSSPALPLTHTHTHTHTHTGWFAGMVSAV